MRLRVADVFRAGASEFLASRNLPTVVHRAVEAIVSCRTAALGGHWGVCADGHFSHWYNACRRRCCPRCSYARVKSWLARQARLLLGCAHHHVVFTIPHDLNELWLLNQALLGDLLFASARSALYTLAADPRYLGAQPGALMALHTWGQQLDLHPHIHCLVTAGGSDASGEWKPSRRLHFLPAEPLKQLFRGAFLGGVARLARADELRLPDGWTTRQVESVVSGMWRKRWNIRVGERYPDPLAVLNYLARYLHGGPFGEGRLVAIDDKQVTFRYKNYRTETESVMRLSRFEFIRRYLLHVPPEGFHMVRGYGLYRRGSHNNHLRDNIAKAVPVAPEIREALADDPSVSWLPEPGKTPCSVCEAPVKRVGTLRPLASWPRAWPSLAA